MAIDLKDDKQLSAACESALQAYRTSPGYMDWTKRLSVFLQKVQEADREEFFRRRFRSGCGIARLFLPQAWGM